MNVEDEEASSAGSYLYSVRIPATRSASDYGASNRTKSGAIIPLEAPQILWQR
jgi:hypothetical protein